MRIPVDWVPVATAARALGVSKTRVYQLVDEGKLNSQELDGVILVSRHSIAVRVQARTHGGAGGGLQKAGR